MVELVTGAQVELFGHKYPRNAAIAAGAVTFVGAYLFYRHRKSSASSAPASSPSSGGLYPPDGTVGNPADPYSTDPNTGETYGNETAQGYLGTPPAGFGGYPGPGSPPPPPTPGPGAFTTNAQWAQAAERYLVEQTGAHAEVVGNALGKYITGQAANEAQVAVIEQAIAFEGYPPVNGPAGYPPNILRAHQPPPPPHPKPGHAPDNLRAHVTGRTAVLTWGKVAGAQSYRLHVTRSITSLPRGTEIRRTATVFGGLVHGESHKLGNLPRRAQLTWTVAAHNTAGDGPVSAPAHFETK